jgi:hypothetical protein
VLGQSLIGKKREYRVVTELIENLLTSIDAKIEVVSISTFPLYIKFKVKVSSVNVDKIDWNFVRLELMYQLGGMISDIHIESRGHESFKEGTRYYIDITKTAITNFEKGTTSFPPFLFKEQNTESLFKAAYLLSQKEELTEANLANKLNIDPNRAFNLYNQLKKSDLKALQKSKNRIN